jgi:hypothetical protein
MIEMRYSEDMNEMLVLYPTQLHLLVAPHRECRKMMTAFAVHLALAGPVRLLDGGNSFDGYGLARELRRRTSEHLDAMQRVWVSRAFTCYQVWTLLYETAAAPVSTLVLDLPNTFYDESVPLAERRRLLAACLEQLERLSRSATVAVSAALPTPGEQEALLSLLEEAAGRVWRFEPEISVPQLRLF